MNNKQQNHKWDTFEGFTKEDLVNVPDEYLNDFLRKKEVTIGRIVAFNSKKHLALVEFRSVTYTDDTVVPPVRRYPMKWAPIAGITKYENNKIIDEIPVNPINHEQSK